jgi:hypothetical protein
VTYKTDFKQTILKYNQGAAENSAAMLFDNLYWLTTKETAVYLRRSVNAIHTLVSRKYLRPRKFANRLYFKKDELDYLLETSIKRGF